MPPADVSWRDHVDVRLADLLRTLEERQLRVDAEFRQQTQALLLARRELERRLEGMNAMRQQLDRQASLFITRDVYDERHEALLGKLTSHVREADLRISSLERMQSKMIGYVLGAAALISIIQLIHWWAASNVVLTGPAGP